MSFLSKLNIAYHPSTFKIKSNSSLEDFEAYLILKNFVSNQSSQNEVKFLDRIPTVNGKYYLAADPYHVVKSITVTKQNDSFEVKITMPRIKGVILGLLLMNSFFFVLASLINPIQYELLPIYYLFYFILAGIINGLLKSRIKDDLENWNTEVQLGEDQGFGIPTVAPRFFIIVMGGFLFAHGFGYMVDSLLKLSSSKSVNYIIVISSVLAGFGVTYYLLDKFLPINKNKSKKISLGILIVVYVLYKI